jgi:hypothetical protein
LVNWHLSFSCSAAFAPWLWRHTLRLSQWVRCYSSISLCLVLVCSLPDMQLACRGGLLRLDSSRSFLLGLYSFRLFLCIRPVVW